MKYKEIILKPIFNYIPEDKDKKDHFENDTVKFSNNTNNSDFLLQNELENMKFKYEKNKDNKTNLIFKKNNTNLQNSSQNKINLTQNDTLLKDNVDYLKILQETDKLIKKLKNISNLNESKTKDFLINSKNNSYTLDNSSLLKTLQTNKTLKNLKSDKKFSKVINNQSNIYSLKYFLKNNKYFLFFELILILFFIFIILKLIKLFFKKNTIPEELIYIIIKDPFEEAIKKTKNLTKLKTLVVKSSEDIPSSAYISGNLIIIGKAKLPKYIYVKGDVTCENYVEIDNLISEKNIKILRGGFLNTLLAAKKSIYLSRDFEGKGILIAEQIITYDYKEYDFDLPINNSKRKIFEYKGNFKIPGEMTLAQDLVIFGNLEILPFAKILGDIKVHGDIKVWNNVKISGGIYSSGKVTLMNNCIVGKDIISANKIEIYPGCRLNIFSGRIATYKDIILHKDICIFGPIISPLKVK